MMELFLSLKLVKDCYNNVVGRYYQIKNISKIYPRRIDHNRRCNVDQLVF